MKRISRIRSTPPSVAVKARVIKSTAKRADTSRQIDVDHSVGIAGGLAPLSTPYRIADLLHLKERSNMLKQCIAAMVTNIGMSGWEIVPAHEGVPMDPAEREELQSFIDSPNSEESLTMLHSKVVDDYESVGFSFVEIIRDGAGRPSIWRHCAASVTRLCPKDPTPQKIQYDVIRGPRVSLVTEYRRFRIYVQEVGGARVYFKEFGDPRTLNYDTGEFATADKPVPRGMEASELIHLRQYSDDEYGLPRWISQLPSILGSREAEEVNLRYFQDNTVPPMLLSVAGGRITAESFKDIQNLLNGQGVGKDRQNQILLIEAVAEKDSLDDKAASVQLKVDKLTDTRPSDGLFNLYDEANQAKLRSSFRLPPVAVGLSQDVTFATANVSTHIAESQVYAPERMLFDEVYNKTVVHGRTGLRLSTVSLRSCNPAITGPETAMKALTALNVMGAVTPRSAQKAAQTILDVSLEEYPQKGEEGYAEWMDMPIAFSLRNATGYDKSHAEQSQKNQKVKDVEEGGDVTFDKPEHGQE